jgi:hypothetical protein
MTRTRTGLMLVPGLLLALALAVAGCGGGNSNGVASLGGDKATPTTSAGGSGDPRQAARNWARCMRQHGINLPDPNIDANEGFAGLLPEGVNPDDPKFKAAQQACQRYAPSGGQPPKLNQQQRQQQLQFARCMRQQGINMPDPDANGGTDMSRIGVDPDGPKFKAAEQACQQYKPNNTQTQSNGGGR